MENSHLLKAFATIAPFIGPILLAVRAEEATAFEKFLYVTMAGPLTIVAVALRYMEDKNSLLSQPDTMTRQACMTEKQNGFRKLLTILVVASFVLAGGAAWLLPSVADCHPRRFGITWAPVLSAQILTARLEK